MAKKIEAWTQFGPRLETAAPMTPRQLVDKISLESNENASSVLTVLTFLDSVIEEALKDGRTVQLPSGTYYKPIGMADGTIEISVRVNPEVVKRLNAEFRGGWQNAQNIDKSEAEIIALWNAEHPDEPIEE